MKKTTLVLLLCTAAVFAVGCAPDIPASEADTVTTTDVSETESLETEFFETEASKKISTEETTVETPAAKTSETKEIAEPVKIGTGIIDLQKARGDGKYSYGGGFFLNGRFFAAKGYYSKNGKDTAALYLYNISDWTLERVIDIADGWVSFGSPIPTDEAGVLLKIEIYYFDDDYDEVYGVMTVYDDYSFDIEEKYEGSVTCCGHKIILGENSIALADGENAGEIISFSGMETPLAIRQADENRFVYQTLDMSNKMIYSGNMGIYDFAEGKNTPLPDLANHEIIGICGGKLYTSKRPGIDSSELFVTDIETLKTSLLSDTSFDEVHKYGVEYAMTEDGKYILCAGGKNKDEGIPGTVYVLDTDTGEIISKYEIPDEIGYTRSIFYSLCCVGDGTAAIICYKEDKIFVFDIKI